MAQRKAGEVEAFLSRPDTSFPVVLLYGPDSGLVAERAARVAALSGADLGDPFSAVTLSADEVEKDAGRLFDEARTVSMFGGRRLVRIRGAGGGTYRALAGALAELGAQPPPEVTVVIEAGDLKPSSPLRAAVEKARAAMALPCYPDEGRALDGMIDAEMQAASLKIGREAREALRERLGANRLASRGEVRKLALYCLGQTEVSLADVEAVVGDVSSETVDEAVDAAASGEVKRLPELLERLASAGTAPFALQQAVLRHFQALQLMRERVERHNDSIPRVVEARRPNFRRKPAFEAALGTWTLEALARALARIEAAILATRKEAPLASAIVADLLIGLAVEAARLRSRGAGRG
ncbi:DNA polymerase III subunit delta [Aureimonas endophytica]|uniref:DNA-directed DNA polymerase n=1 Tax=Aureimonas endophytica TaxID=2027858 RepID=A0A917E6Z5_9HYPH|nr:DNA polymerase III subunit delta [Aureimonas endophytica]GGE06827.1 DNA polymerase III subunit delta [Aureimonas endophytica]